MKTAVVILNWNTKDYLRKFLPPLLDSVRGLDAEVIVADSASTDGSMEMMAEEFPDIRRVPLGENFGFTGGYNRALAGIDATYYVLINSDIEVPSGWLEPLAGWMDTHPECGVCGPKLLSWYQRDTFEYSGAAGGLLDRLGYPFCRGRVMQKIEKDTGQYDDPASVMWVSGACMMVRSGLWKALGGFDDRFFAHMEEIDFCWRAQLEGYRVTVVPESKVYHIGGGNLPSTSPWKLKLNFRNDLLMMENNLARTYASMGYRHPFGKAKRILLWRRILDGFSALVYLFSGNLPYFKAVLSAHREFRILRRKPDPETVRTQKAVRLDGFCSFWMIPKAIFGKL